MADGQQYDEEMRFVLFQNEKKQENSPSMTGTIQINGVKYKLAAWTKFAQSSGKKFLSGTVQLVEDQPAAAPSAYPEEDLPF